MWNKFEESSNEDETLGNSFFTNGLFKISNENEVIQFKMHVFCRKYLSKFISER